LEAGFQKSQSVVFRVINPRIASKQRRVIVLFFQNDVSIEQGGDRGTQGFWVDAETYVLGHFKGLFKFYFTIWRFWQCHTFNRFHE